MATKTDTKTTASTFNRCACGCKSPTARTFAPGHDAKLKSLVLQVVRDEIPVTKIPKEAREFALSWSALGSNRRALKKRMAA